MHPQSQKAGLLPSLIARTSYKALSVALALCLVCPSVPVFAAETDEAALGHAEKILFGNEILAGDINERILRVEKRIFGRKKAGSEEERVERITSTLLIDRKKLKVTRKADDKPSSVETSSEKQAEKTAEKQAEKPAESAAETSAAPVVQAASSTSPAESATASSVSAASASSAEPSKEATSSAKETVKDIAKQFGEEFAKDTSIQPEAQVAHEPAAQPKSAKGKGQKGKGKTVAKGSAKGAGRGVGKQAVTASNKATDKKPEVTLTAETAALDARNAEKRPAVHETPVTYSSASSNRISRVAAPKASQATALLREGMEAHRKGEDAKAEQLFKKVVTLEPRNPDGYFNLGALAEKKKDLAGALMSYRAALTLTPNDRELQDAVDSVESQLGVETTSSHVARESSRSGSGSRAGSTSTHSAASRASSSQTFTANEGTSGSDREAEEARRAEIRAFYGRSNERENGDREYGGRETVSHHDAFESSDRFESQPGTYGFGPNGRRAHNGPQSAPNFYRARARTTREIQEEAAAYMDVNDPNAPMMSVGSPPPPVANANQPQPFQLQTQRNQAAAQATQRKGPSAAGIATRAILGVALQVGTSYALRSTGMHCPVCRIGGGGGALRGLLRF